MVTPTDSHRLNAESTEDKEEWTALLREAIAASTPREKTEKAEKAEKNAEKNSGSPKTKDDKAKAAATEATTAHAATPRRGVISA